MATTLKRTYASKDEIPGIELYVEKDGKFTLNPDYEFEGMVGRNQLDTFRDNNVKMRQRLEAFGDNVQMDARGNITGFGGGKIDPEKALELLEREKELSDGNLTKKSEVNERVEQRVKEEKQKWEVTKGQLETQLNDLKGKHRKVVIENKALELAIPLGLRKDEGAKNSLALEVNSVWGIDESGNPVAFESDGKTVRYDKDGAPMRGEGALRQYVENMAKSTHKFMFANNEGGGADRGAVGGGTGGGFEYNGEDPFKPGPTYNRTAQRKLMEKDFPTAKRLAAKNGIPDLRPLGT